MFFKKIESFKCRSGQSSPDFIPMRSLELNGLLLRPLKRSVNDCSIPGNQIRRDSGWRESGMLCIRHMAASPAAVPTVMNGQLTDFARPATKCSRIFIPAALRFSRLLEVNGGFFRFSLEGSNQNPSTFFMIFLRSR